MPNPIDTLADNANIPAAQTNPPESAASSDKPKENLTEKTKAPNAAEKSADQKQVELAEDLTQKGPGPGFSAAEAVDDDVRLKIMEIKLGRQEASIEKLKIAQDQKAEEQKKYATVLELNSLVTRTGQSLDAKIAKQIDGHNALGKRISRLESFQDSMEGLNSVNEDIFAKLAKPLTDRVKNLESSASLKDNFKKQNEDFTKQLNTQKQNHQILEGKLEKTIADQQKKIISLEERLLAQETELVKINAELAKANKAIHEQFALYQQMLPTITAISTHIPNASSPLTSNFHHGLTLFNSLTPATPPTSTRVTADSAGSLESSDKSALFILCSAAQAISQADDQSDSSMMLPEQSTTEQSNDVVSSAKRFHR